MRPRTSVINVTHDMQMIYDKLLDELTNCNNKFRSPSDPDDRVHDFIVISLFILHLGLFRDQLLYDICKILWQRLADLGTRILGGNTLCDLHQTIQCDLVPVLQIVLLFHDNIQLFVGIIDQRRQTFFVLIAQSISKFFVNLAADRTGSVFQYMIELLIFPMNVCQKMLRALWQVQDRR